MVSFLMKPRGKNYSSVAISSPSFEESFMALTKADLAENLFENLGYSKRDAKETVEVFFEEIRKSLESGEQVKLSGFGNFDLRDKKERPGRNPKTGEDIPISARRVVTFRPGQKLKARVEELKKDDIK
ncbi:Integration host factor subunit alpha [Vibrio rarus]